MADNVTSGANTFATDEIGGVHYPVEKLAFGALDTATLVTPSAGLPVNIVASSATGALAVAHGTNPTAVAAGARIDWLANRQGIPFMIGGHPNTITKEFTITAVKTDADLLGAIAPGAKVVVLKASALVSAACTVAVGVRIGFGTATLPAPADAGTGAVGLVLSHPGLSPGGGYQAGDGGDIIGIGGDGAELRITNTVPTGGSLVVLVTYFTIES